jgi:16S rRNA (cytosine1402-N4)-methyltransferase
LEVLNETIDSCARLLDSGGRLLIISFHSLEDRIVKTAFKELTAACVCPKGVPVCVCGGVPRFTAVSKKPVLPADDEIERNPRARSAKLRVIEKN